MDRDYRNGTALHQAATFGHCPLSSSGTHDWIAFRLGRACRVCQMTLSMREWEAVAGGREDGHRENREDI